MRNKFEDSKNALEFIKGGNATFTICSAKNRYTYKVIKTHFDESKYFVMLLTGSDNNNDFSYVGMLFPNRDKITLTTKSVMTDQSLPVVAFNYTYKRLLNGYIPKGVSIYHEGRCGSCGRKLTVPESIESGFGPHCLSKLG